MHYSHHTHCAQKASLSGTARNRSKTQSVVSHACLCDCSVSEVVFVCSAVMLADRHLSFSSHSLIHTRKTHRKPAPPPSGPVACCLGWKGTGHQAGRLLGPPVGRVPAVRRSRKRGRAPVGRGLAYISCLEREYWDGDPVLARESDL